MFCLFVKGDQRKRGGRKQLTRSLQSRISCDVMQMSELLTLTKLALLLGNSDTFNTLKQCHFQHIDLLEKKVASLRKQVSS